jgi:hypothetical protein
MSEQDEFHRDAATAIRFLTKLSALCGLDPDLELRQQAVRVEAVFKEMQAAGAVAPNQVAALDRMGHDIANLRTTIETRERELSDARDLVDNLERGREALRVLLKDIRAKCPADPDINPAWEAVWKRLEQTT